MLSGQLTRRQFLVSAGVLALGTAFPVHAGPWRRHPEILALLDGREPVHGGLRLELPSVSDTGSNVPVTLDVDSVMDADAHVRRVHLLAPANPNPEVFSADFSPLAGQARLSTRIRLNETQRVYALAEMSDGRVRIASTETRVTVSGCLTEADTYDSDDLMRTRVRAPSRFAKGESIELLALINHPMETGLRMGSDGALLPRHIVESFTLTLDGEPLISMRLHPSMSANPFLRIALRPQRGGALLLTWQDDQGRVVQEHATLEAS